MIPKLALAAQEVLWESIHNQSDTKLIESLRQHYYEIVDGIGAHKTPKKHMELFQLIRILIPLLVVGHNSLE
ncbi:MAG: hypothetical protein CM15mP83_2650 [Flavobacteriaceae bacterium]|nr:MAG: hypothetical protein CM15mP83_2650 [Flavobacteriaceae bacterium]